MSKQPQPAPTASVVGPCPTLIQISRTPRHWKLTQHHRTTRPPQPGMRLRMSCFCLHYLGSSPFGNISSQANQNSQIREHSSATTEAATSLTGASPAVAVDFHISRKSVGVIWVFRHISTKSLYRAEYAIK